MKAEGFYFFSCVRKRTDLGGEKKNNAISPLLRPCRRHGAFINQELSP
jgi:hypothetical protein